MPSELTRAVRWDCDRHTSVGSGVSGHILGIDQSSTVGLRPVRAWSDEQPEPVISELTRAVRWDCDNTHNGRASPGFFWLGIDQGSTVGLRPFFADIPLENQGVPSELTRAVRWDCNWDATALVAPARRAADSQPRARALGKSTNKTIIAPCQGRPRIALGRARNKGYESFSQGSRPGLQVFRPPGSRKRRFGSACIPERRPLA